MDRRKRSGQVDTGEHEFNRSKQRKRSRRRRLKAMARKWGQKDETAHDAEEAENTLYDPLIVQTKLHLGRHETPASSFVTDAKFLGRRIFHWKSPFLQLTYFPINVGLFT